MVSSSVIELDVVERNRLVALHEYCVLDAPADDELSAVVRVAAIVADVPTATLNLIDENRQCQLTTVGFDSSNSPRSDSMCAIQFRTGRMVHVPDASQDPIYATNPWVTGRLADVRFYASAPLVTPEGYALGTLCVFDQVVKSLTPEQVSRIEDLADVLVALFERRRQSRLNEQLATESERRKKFTDTVLETIDVGIAVADSDGHVTLLNRAARDWHGADPDPSLEPAELPLRYDLFEPDGVTPMSADNVPLIRALHEDHVADAEMIIKGPHRAPMTVSANGRRLVDDDGTTLGAVVAMNDVTSDRAYRRELEKTYAALTERGEQLTAAIVELERSNDELEQFAGAVSHDLVRPMAAAHGYLELLADAYRPVLDDRGDKWLNTATRAVERMQQLVQSLLTYARSGHAPYQPQPVNLTETLGDVLADLGPVIEAAGAEVTVPTDLPTVVGDPTLLRQLLQNLIENATKYRSPDRPCRIAVDADRRTDTWTIAIADNGIGIPAEHRDRVFEMFAQVDTTTRQGHGIGLSTCQRITERHSGTITISDTPGGGTTFTLTLPNSPT
ncbi:ATP-binding protein [Micromonosporaceae bacterium Da 78-11]